MKPRALWDEGLWFGKEKKKRRNAKWLFEEEDDVWVIRWENAKRFFLGVIGLLQFCVLMLEEVG
jgi:hypothetical protein